MSQVASPSPQAQLDDLRASLAAQASRAEQRNRPRVLLIAACFVLVIGAWFAWGGYSKSTDAADSAASQQRYADNVLKAAGRWQALQSHGEFHGYEPMAQLYSRIEAMGGPAGLKNRVPIGASQTKSNVIPTSDPKVTTKWNQVKTTYNIKDPELSAVLKWVDLVVSDIPGMEVHTIQVRPEPTDWNVTVVFSRWEKAEGGT